MPYELVAEKLKTLQEAELSEVSAFIDFMRFHNAYTEQETVAKRHFGMAKGQLSYPDDIDEDNEEIAKLFGAY